VFFISTEETRGGGRGKERWREGGRERERERETERTRKTIFGNVVTKLTWKTLALDKVIRESREKEYVLRKRNTHAHHYFFQQERFRLEHLPFT